MNKNMMVVCKIMGFVLDNIFIFVKYYCYFLNG